MARDGRGLQRTSRVVSAVFIAVGASAFAPSTFAANPCVVTPAELQAATGRAFADGEAGKDITGQYDQCSYAEKANPKRKLIVSVRTVNAKKQFEANKRLLHFGKDPIDIAGVGDAAFFSGTAAGVLKGDKALLLSGVRRASDPKIPREKVAELLRAALKRSE